MKNRILLFIFFGYFFLFNFSYSEIVKFESPELKILDSGNKVIANNGVIMNEYAEVVSSIFYNIW